MTSGRRLLVLALCALLLVGTGCGRAGGPVPPTTPPSTGSTVPSAPAATPGEVREPPAVEADQRFGFDDVAEFPDGLELEMAGTVASQAEPTVRGAESTRGQLVTVSILIRNNTAEPYDASRVQVTASYGAGTPAPLVLDTVGELQSGFTGLVDPTDETVAPFGFAIPFDQLAAVSYVVDPADGVHQAVSFTGRVERQ